MKYNRYEKRKAKMSINKVGGNASKSARNYRLLIPTNWANFMEIYPYDREMEMIFDYDTQSITIRKADRNLADIEKDIREHVKNGNSIPVNDLDYYIEYFLKKRKELMESR